MKHARVWAVGLCGAIGGAVNAFLCLVKIPVDVGGLRWHIVPAGAVHGGLLALISAGFAVLCYGRKAWIKAVGLLAAGGISGWLSFISLRLSINDRWELENIWWPLEDGHFIEKLTQPYTVFGLVGFIYYFFLCILNLFHSKNLGIHVLIAAISGCLGSLYWWAVMDRHWYLSPLHGTIWGVCVGFGMWWLTSGNKSR